MEFIGYNSSLITPFMFIAVLGIILGMNVSSPRSKFYKATPGIICSVLLILVGASLTFYQSVIVPHRASQERIELMNEAYGIDMTDGYQELRYPSSKPAAGEFIEFGSVANNLNESVDKNFITLVWDGSEMQLFESDSENNLGTELPRA